MHKTSVLNVYTATLHVWMGVQAAYSGERYLMMCFSGDGVRQTIISCHFTQMHETLALHTSHTITYS